VESTYPDKPMTNILAIWFPKPGTFNGRDEIISVNTNEIKDSIVNLLYRQHANNLLIKYKSKLYVIEPNSDEMNKYGYTRREINYHPLQNKL